MKILYFGFDFSVLGGLQIHNKTFFDVIHNSGNPTALVELKKSSFWGKLSFIGRALAKVITFRPDIIIVGHVNFSPFCLLIKKFFGIRYAVTVHGIDVWEIKSKMKIEGLKGAASIISVSHYTEERMVKEIPELRDKVVVIAPTVDSERFTIAEKSAALIASHNLAGKKIVLTVARLSKEEGYKGYDKVIRAFPKILAAVPNAHYVIVGNGSDRERMEELVNNLKLEHSVTFAGRVTDEVLPDYYNLADVFAMPSKGEGFGIVFIEAAACGIPVIAGNQDGSVDAALNGELGLLINPDSIEEIEQAIIEVLRGTARADFYNKNALREKTVMAFGIQSFKGKIADLITQLESAKN